MAKIKAQVKSTPKKRGVVKPGGGDRGIITEKILARVKTK